MPWQLQEAKQKFSRLVDMAIRDGPQVITRHGRAVVVVVAAEQYAELTGAQRDFKDFLLSGPDLTSLELERMPDYPRELEL